MFNNRQLLCPDCKQHLICSNKSYGMPSHSTKSCTCSVCGSVFIVSYVWGYWDSYREHKYGGSISE